MPLIAFVVLMIVLVMLPIETVAAFSLILAYLDWQNYRNGSVDSLGNAIFMLFVGILTLILAFVAN